MEAYPSSGFLKNTFISHECIRERKEYGFKKQKKIKSRRMCGRHGRQKNMCNTYCLQKVQWGLCISKRVGNFG